MSITTMGITINGKHSYTDYGLYLADRSITLPERQPVRVTIPYMSGYYDFSALYGGPYYGSRTLTYTFDLHLAGLEPEAIERYNYYLVTHDGIGLNTYYRVVKVVRDICNPTEITYEMGGQSKSLASVLTDASGKASSAVADATAAVNGQLAKTVTALIVSNATIRELQVSVAEIDDLTAEVANINSLLAGNIGTGTVQTVHLTADNVVIDDAIITSAMIASVTADKITSGTIYTDLVTIQSESGNLYIADNTIQIQDANSVVRVQIGEDATGDYNLYLWDSSGNLLWDAEGLYAAGIHDGIIKDVAIADDAAISGYKIDISTMTSALNEYGELVIDAAQITIDGTTLDYKLTTMATATAEARAAADAAAEVAAALKSDAVANLTQYYAVGDSAAEPPSAPEDGVTRAAALADTAVADESRVGIVAASDWTTEWLTASDGLYLWTAFFVAYADGAAEWTTPTCLSDSAARDSISTLVTELEVVQGQIAAKVWQTDIDEATDELNESITTLQDRYSTMTQTVDGITTEVADLTTVVGDNYISLQTKITTVEQTAEGLTSRVTEAESSISANATSITTLSSEITQMSDAIALCVTTDADTGYLRLGAGDDGTVKFTIDADNLTLDEDGNLAMTGNLTVLDSITMSSDTAVIKGPTRVRFESIIYSNYGIVVPNSDGTDGHAYYGKTTDGDNIRLLWINDSDSIRIGRTDYPINISGSSVTINGYAVPEMQHGRVTVSLEADTVTSFSVTFSQAFPGQPEVFLTVVHDSGVSSLYCKARATSATGFTGYIRSSGGGNHSICWLAVYG